MYLSKWKGKQTGHTKAERNEFKEYFFGNLFYNQFNNRLTDLEQIFATYYPKEFKSLRSLKEKLGNKGLAVEVQKLEGFFFHTIVVNHMRTNYKDVHYCIKHDSIAIPESAAAYIYPELNALAAKFFNRPEIQLKWEVK
jgi:hypothetical protein